MATRGMAKGPETPISESLKATYDRLEMQRQPYLDRARECSLLTLPMVFPNEGDNASTQFYRPYQSIGARGVNNLANKLLLSLLPPNTPFFKLSADDQTVAQLVSEKDRATVEEKFNEIERTIQTSIETSSYRAPFIQAMKQLVIGGNVLLLLKDNGNVRVIKMDKYVVRRDAEGKVLEVVIKEMSRFKDLPEDIQQLVANSDTDPDEAYDSTKQCDIYTGFKLVGKSWKTYQTIKDIMIPGTKGTYPKDKAPFIALRWAIEDNEDWGRSYVEEYIGDLQSAEGLSKAVIEATAAAAKVVILVNPNGMTQEQDITEAENLDVKTGRDEDVTMLQLNKQADLSVAQSILNDILQRLSYAFLMNTAIQRDAERVTAEEIREMVKELEDALGGTYALFAQEFQLPFVRIKMAQMVKAKKIPDLDALKKDGIEIEPTITTGVEAIGRGQDLNKLLTFVREFIVPFGEQAIQELNYGDFLKRGGAALGIDMDGLIKDQQQKQAEAEEAEAEQNAQMGNQMIGDVAGKVAGPIAKGAMDGAASPSPQPQ